MAFISTYWCLVIFTVVLLWTSLAEPPAYGWCSPSLNSFLAFNLITMSVVDSLLLPSFLCWCSWGCAGSFSVLFVGHLAQSTLFPIHIYVVESTLRVVALLCHIPSVSFTHFFSFFICFDFENTYEWVPISNEVLSLLPSTSDEYLVNTVRPRLNCHLRSRIVQIP